MRNMTPLSFDGRIATEEGSFPDSRVLQPHIPDYPPLAGTAAVAAIAATNPATNPALTSTPIATEKTSGGIGVSVSPSLPVHRNRSRKAQVPGFPDNACAEEKGWMHFIDWRLDVIFSLVTCAVGFYVRLLGKGRAEKQWSQFLELI